jgi:DNA polymerase I
MDVKNSIFIIDGSSFLYRAYYSVRPLHTREGVPVNAVYGFCRMIKKLLDTYQPHAMIVVWDSPGRTVRHELYGAYKETRQAAPSDLMEQKKLIQEFADTLGLQQLQKEGIEADDLMFSLAKQLEQEKTHTVIVSSDKDMGQMLSDYIVILDPFKDTFITREDLEKKLEFSLDKLPFYYALIGDASDNIPGVKGIGPKGAQQLVKQFDSLEDLYKNLDKVPSERIRLLLEQSRNNAFLSEELFKLRFYETYVTKECCDISLEDWAKAHPFFEKLEFKSFLKNEEKKEVKESPIAQKYTLILVDTREQLNEVYNKLKKHKRCALDTESLGAHPLQQGGMVGFSLSMEEGMAYYIPFGHKTGERQLEKEYILSTLKPFLEDPTIEKYLHHAKYDALMLASENIELKGVVFDTLIAASLLVGDGQRIGLKYLSEYYLGEPMLFFNDIVKKNKYKDFSYVPLPVATEYAAADAHQTLRLHALFEKGIREQGMADLFHKLEMPFMHVLLKMEKAGISLDTHILREIDVKVSQELVRLRTEIIDLIGHEHADINLNSPKQLEELLFEKLKLPPVKRTAGRTSYSTDHQVLRDLAKLHPVPALIMRYRELFKLKSTYLDALGEHINPHTGRVHSTFSQTGVATGRLASSEPNLQNIPVDKFRVRSAFKPTQGYVFLSADYSQIELRILAHVSQDETLLKAFKENQDIHALTAAGLFEVHRSEVTHEQRQIGKRINFSILYGLTAHGLAQDLEIPHSLAKQYIEKYMAQYPGVVAWMEKVIEETKRKGYVQTAWGRRRYLPGIYEKNKTLYDLARRVAINTIPQGTASEIMKWGMLQLDKVLSEYGLGARMVLQIHDELLLEVPESEVEKTEDIVRTALQNVVSWSVPLVVTTRVGHNWQEVTK